VRDLDVRSSRFQVEVLRRFMRRVLAPHIVTPWGGRKTKPLRALSPPMCGLYRCSLATISEHREDFARIDSMGAIPTSPSG
jgi:hypothetical protein